MYVNKHNIYESCYGYLLQCGKDPVNVPKFYETVISDCTSLLCQLTHLHSTGLIKCRVTTGTKAHNGHDVRTASCSSCLSLWSS